jgi:peptidoglycan pentaglycine glycine transferase (the first glycine)
MPDFSTVSDSAHWDAALAALPRPQLLQSWRWGEFKARHGWSARRYLWTEAGRPAAAAQVLKRSLGPLSILYAPRGPLLD